MLREIHELQVWQPTRSLGKIKVRKYIQRTAFTGRLYQMINKVWLHVSYDLLGAILIALS